jgi:DNA-binding beta-propeller fold protein YncE
VTPRDPAQRGTPTAGQLAVISDRESLPRVVREISLSSVGANPGSLALTHDGRYLLVADGSGAVVISAARAERGERGAVVGRLLAATALGYQADDSAIEVSISPDDRFAFVSLEYASRIAVFDFQRALGHRFHVSGFVGTIRLGFAVVGTAFSPDGRWLYATSELGSASGREGGKVSVIDVHEAETRPGRSVVASAPAGCDPVRVAVSPGGSIVWVTARESSSLLAFSAARLRADPRHALLARVRVGPAPVGLAVTRGGRLVIVLDSNRFSSTQAGELSVVDTKAALAHRHAVIGSISVGAFPREATVVPRRNWLLVTNFGSNQLDVIPAARIP